MKEDTVLNRLHIIGHSFLTHSFSSEKKKEEHPVYVAYTIIITIKQSLIELADLVEVRNVLRREISLLKKYKPREIC